MLSYLLLTSILATAHSWVLTSTHTTIIPQLTEDVTLDCFYEGSNEEDCHEVEEITRIRLLKMNSKDAWNTFAEIVLPNTSLVKLTASDMPGVLVSGHLKHLNDSFLSVTWSYSSGDTAGSYKCEVDCIVIDNRNDVHVTTSIVNLTQSKATIEDLVDALVQMRKKSKKLSEELKFLQEETSVQRQKHIFDINSQAKSWSQIMSQNVNSLKEESQVKHLKLQADMESEVMNLSEIMFQEIYSLKEELTKDMSSLARNWSQGLSQEMDSLKQESLAKHMKLQADMESQARNLSDIMSEEIYFVKEELKARLSSQVEEWSNATSSVMSLFSEESLAKYQNFKAEMENQARNQSEKTFKEINSLREELAFDINERAKNWSNIIFDEMSSLKDENFVEHLNLRAYMKSQAKNWSEIMSDEINFHKEELREYVQSQAKNWSTIMSQEINSLREESLAEHVKLNAEMRGQDKNRPNATSSRLNLLKEEVRTQVNNQVRNWSNIMSQEMHSFKNESLAEYQKLEGDLNSKSRKWSEKISKEIASLKTKILPQYQNLTASMKSQVHSEIVKNYFELRHWPAGNYALLKTDSGCPDTFSSKFGSGYSQFQTQTSRRPQHSFTSASNLSRDMFKRYGWRNVLKFEFCVSSIKEPRVSWPTGTYCISYKQDDCPTGFNYGYSYFYLETSRSIIGKNLHDSTYYDDDYVGINYCCRRDGSPHTPILLPNTKPFYLYRYRGHCQKVQGMEVQDQSYILDTDEGEESYVSHVDSPDIRLNQYTPYLCYYYKKQD